jgi:hypothetical protein
MVKYMGMENKEKEFTGDVLGFGNIPVRELAKGIVVYESYMVGLVDDILNGIIEGVYYRFIMDEIKEYASKENKFVNVLVGFRHIEIKNDKGRMEGRISVIISCINELQSIEDLRLRLSKYVLFDSRDLRKLMGPRNESGLLADNMEKILELAKDVAEQGNRLMNIV